MNNLNYVFFEEYKHLDKLCAELYRDQHGISRYIDDMKNVSENDCRFIPGWKDDLKRLIRLRHIRNYLAHTEGAFNEEICTQKHIEWSQEFLKRILNQSDPLAMLYQYSKARQQTEKANLLPLKPQTPQSSTHNDSDIKKVDFPATKKKTWIYWIIVLLVIVGILFLFLSAITGLQG